MDGAAEINGDAQRPARLDVTAARVLVEAEIFHDRRVELIEGVLVEMSPAKNEHAAAHSALTIAIASKIGADLRAFIDPAIYLTDDVMLAPDIAILLRGVTSDDAKGSDLALVIEISDSSLEYDLGKKARLYAASGVSDYWVVDLPNRLVHLHRDPSEAGYGQVEAVAWSAKATALNIPGLKLILADVMESVDE